MLSIKCIFTLNYTCMEFAALFLSSFHKGISHFQVCYRRKFDRCILFAGSLHTNSTCCNDNISALYFWLHSTTGSDTYKSICTAAIKFFHCNRSRRSADSGGSHAYLYSVQSSGISHIFTIVCHQNRIIKIFCDFFAAFRISR